ncbi:MAG: hypothetical protein ABI759_27880 [Candidatus Solibacter sp.]
MLRKHMVRGLLSLLILGVVLLVAAPLVVGSFYLDRLGVELTGHVYSKSEYVRLQNLSWSRASEVTFEVEAPDTSSPRFFNSAMAPARYDTFHKGQPVRVHYLRRADIPKLPGADAMWQMHMLPSVRLADERAFEGLRRGFTPQVTLACEAVLGLAIVLWLWRRSRWPGFAWAMGLTVAVGIVLLMFYDFPRPTPAPAADIRQATGKVKSVGRIDHLFATRRSRGWPAHQPVDVCGIEFLPDGRQDPVLAVDLVDRDAAGRFAEGAPVTVDYESATPRTAYLRGASRTFLQRNLVGAASDGALWIGVLVALLLLASGLGKLWSRMVGRVGQRSGSAPGS